MAADTNFLSDKLTYRTNEMSYRNSWYKFFLPDISLGLNFGSTSYTLGQFSGVSNKADLGYEKYKEGYLKGHSLTISAGKYKLFNGWEDWNSLDSARLKWDADRRQFAEKEKELRADVVQKILNLKVALEQLDAAKRSLTIAEAIEAQVKSAVRVGKAQEAEYQSAVSDLAKAKESINSLETEVRNAGLELNPKLGDPIGTKYLVQETVKFTPLRLTTEEAYSIALDQSSSVFNSKTALRAAELNLRTAEKALVPYPTLDISGASISYQISDLSTSRTVKTDGGANFDVGVTISAGITIPLYDPSTGFLSHYRLETARNDFEKQDLAYTASLINLKKDIMSKIDTIKSTETSLINDKQQADSDMVVLNNAFSQIGKKEVNRLELRESLNKARESEAKLLKDQIDHLSKKLDLCKTLGVPNLPGDNLSVYFEN